MTALDRALAMIDAANAADPTQTDGRPAALVYGERMSAELARRVPGASDVLKIAARGQHVERWMLPRRDFPEGKAGYYAWRQEQARRHAARVGGFMADAGYGAEDCARVGVLLRKEGLKRDAEVQALEDVICFVFLRWYFAGFAEGRADIVEIVAKTARKMSGPAREQVLAEFALPEALAEAVRAAG